MRAQAIAVAVLLLCGCRPKDPPPRPQPTPAELIPEGIYAAGDINQLRKGTWHLIYQVNDGAPYDDDVTWNFDLDTFEVHLRRSFGKTFYYRLDPTKSPKRFAAGPQMSADGRGANTTGIYRLEGDTFELCVDNSARQFPAAFDGSKGTGFMLYRFKRE